MHTFNACSLGACCLCLYGSRAIPLYSSHEKNVQFLIFFKETLVSYNQPFLLRALKRKGRFQNDSSKLNHESFVHDQGHSDSCEYERVD